MSTIVVTFLSLQKRKFQKTRKAPGGEKKTTLKVLIKNNAFIQCFLQNFEALSDVGCKCFKEDHQKLGRER